MDSSHHQVTEAENRSQLFVAQVQMAVLQQMVCQLFIEDIDVAVRTRAEVADCPADDLQ